MNIRGRLEPGTAVAAYRRQPRRMDRELNRAEPGTAEFGQRWTDRTAYAANGHPDHLPDPSSRRGGGVLAAVPIPQTRDRDFPGRRHERQLEAR